VNIHGKSGDGLNREPGVADMPARLGGRLCLDFVNTVEFRASASPVHYLGSYADLVAWSLHVHIVDEVGAELLLREAARRSAVATATFAWAITVRESMYGVFAAVAAELAPDQHDLDTLNTALSVALSQSRIVVTLTGFEWSSAHRAEALDRVLWPICRSVLDLLTSKDIRRVKDCARHGGCGWLFVDASKNGSRRWCSMQVCGRQEKVRRRTAVRRSQLD
jgi:predicted RNA-binding Zn ribbon-like protein